MMFWIDRITVYYIAERGDPTLHAESIQNISNIWDSTILHFPRIQAIKHANTNTHLVS